MHIPTLAVIFHGLPTGIPIFATIRVHNHLATVAGDDFLGYCAKGSNIALKRFRAKAIIVMQ